MSQVVIEGYVGGKLLLSDQQQVTAFFFERFMTGLSCCVSLGPVVNELLALRPGEHLDLRIAEVDDIYACEAHPTLDRETPEVVLMMLSSFRHYTNKLVISQEKLRQAVLWAGIAREASHALVPEQSGTS